MAEFRSTVYVAFYGNQPGGYYDLPVPQSPKPAKILGMSARAINPQTNQIVEGITTTLEGGVMILATDSGTPEIELRPGSAVRITCRRTTATLGAPVRVEVILTTTEGHY